MAKAERADRGRASLELPLDQWDWGNLTDLQKVAEPHPEFPPDLDAVRAEVVRDPSLARYNLGRGRTLLHAAAESRHLPLVRTLLESGADPNARELHGTPLHEAGGDTELIGVLLDGGADPNILDGWGRNPLALAVQYHDEAAALFLLARGSIPCDERSRAWVAQLSSDKPAEPGAAADGPRL